MHQGSPNARGSVWHLESVVRDRLRACSAIIVIAEPQVGLERTTGTPCHLSGAEQVLCHGQ